MNKLQIIRQKPEIVFLSLGLFFGALYLIFSPPLHEMDGPNHFKRAYQISMGQFLPEKANEAVGGYIPSSVLGLESVLTEGIVSNPKSKLHLSTYQSLRKIKFSKDDLTFIDFRNTALYSPIAYMPQSFGLLLARLLHLSVIVGIMLGRLFNFLIWLVLVYYAIKNMPILKWVMALYALMPISIFLTTSLSTDALTIGLSFLTIGLMLNLILNKGSKITKKTLLLMVAIALFLSLAKQGYASLLLMCVLIPREKFSSNLKRILFTCLILGSALLATVVWATIIKGYYLPIASNVNPGQQLRFIADGHIYWYIIMLRDNFLLWYVGEYNKHLFSYNLGWHDIVLPAWMTASYPLIISFVFLNEDKKKYLFSLAKRMVILLIFFLTYALIASSVYLSSNGVGSVIIFLQGRYFLPFTILLLVFLYSTLFQVERKVNVYRIVFTYCFIILSVSLYTIIQKYY